MHDKQDKHDKQIEHDIYEEQDMTRLEIVVIRLVAVLVLVFGLQQNSSCQHSLAVAALCFGANSEPARVSRLLEGCNLIGGQASIVFFRHSRTLPTLSRAGTNQKEQR